MNVRGMLYATAKLMGDANASRKDRVERGARHDRKDYRWANTQVVQVMHLQYAIPTSFIVIRQCLVSQTSDATGFTTGRRTCSRIGNTERLVAFALLSS
ncbi:MAG: hypothetical protein ACOC9B_02405 [Chloroflexota bacterium]